MHPSRTMSTAKQGGPKAIRCPQTEKSCEVNRPSTHHDVTNQRKGQRHFDWRSFPAEKGFEAHSGRHLSQANSMRNPEYILSRYFEIDYENEPLRHEAAVAIAEQRVHQGENMLRKKVTEEGWCVTENNGSSTDPERGSLDQNSAA